MPPKLTLRVTHESSPPSCTTMTVSRRSYRSWTRRPVLNAVPFETVVTSVYPFCQGEVKVHRDAEATSSTNRRGRIGAGLALALALAAPALLMWAWSRPAAAGPFEGPPLVLDPHEVDAQLAADRERASRAPRGAAIEAR